MRWTVIGLVLLNMIFLLWNWLEYSHRRGVEAMNVQASTGAVALPGEKILLLREQVLPTALQVPVDGVVEPLNIVESSAVAGDADSQIDSGQQSGCLLLGPYPEAQAAGVLIERLGALEIESKYAGVEVAGEPDYWVYLPPEPTKELALARLKELQEKKIDSFIVNQGEIANGISLGVFDRQENADNRRAAILEQGYDAQIRINPRSYRENWVVIYPEFTARFSPELYSQLRSENNKLDLRKEECNKVASPVDIH